VFAQHVEHVGEAVCGAEGGGVVGAEDATAEIVGALVVFPSVFVIAEGRQVVSEAARRLQGVEVLLTQDPSKPVESLLIKLTGLLVLT
jgi:hypothetical protein